jgi:cytochrome c peroxidase
MAKRDERLPGRRPQRPQRPLLLALLVIVAACSSSDPRASVRLRDLVTAAGMQALPLADSQDPAQVALGRMLFFDPILSGARDISCSTCHHPEHGGSDGRGLSVGTEAVRTDGGPRLPGPDHTFASRNAIALWDVGAAAVRVGFWDARIERQADGKLVLYDTGYDSSGQLRIEVPEAASTIAAAVALFPVLDRDEMRGEWGRDDIDGNPNELAMIIDSDFEAVWRGLMARLQTVEAYRELFAEAFPGHEFGELQFAHAASAIGSFLAESFASNRPGSRPAWDAFLAGDDGALNESEARGGLLFYGRAGCVTCHAGELMSDQDSHNLAVRPIGIGAKNDDVDVDLGAAGRSHAGDDQRYAFRTPRLRNVSLSGPWMHNGIYASLRDVIRHKTNPIAGLYREIDPDLPPELAGQVHRSAAILTDVAANVKDSVRKGVALDDQDIDDLLAFLDALESPHGQAMVEQMPEEVPSGAPLVAP